MTPTNEQIISQEISSYEEMLKKASILRDKVDEAKRELYKSYLGIVEAKNEFERIKKENIEEIRLYRQTIQREAADIEKAMSSITKARTSELKEYLEICNGLNALKASGFTFP